jgi:TetR/AcrR family transcriptional regulator, cholesterol catabolism regulator
MSGRVQDAAGESAEQHWSVEAEARRRLVIERAAEMFDRDGYHRVNMTEIATAVGIRKPTLYHYFPSKTAILFEIHEDFFDPALEHAEAASKLAPREGIISIMVDILQLMESHPGHLRVVFEHHRELAEPEQSIVRKKRDRYHELVESLVVRGMKAGEFRSLSPRLTTLGLFGMCNWAYQWYQPGPLTAGEIGEFLADLLLEGLTSPDRRQA